MKKTNYENKLLDLEITNKVVKKSKKKKDSYILISPTGNQYVVKAAKLEHFKLRMKVDKSWTIK